jgi:membrane-bound lytic murein transglycosylase D
MTAKYLLNLILLVLPFSLPTIALAEKNLSGEDIVVSGDAEASISLNPSTQTDPIVNFLQEKSDSPAENTQQAGMALSSDDLWKRIKKGYGMPELESPYTAKNESWYASRPDYVKRMVSRSQKYLFHIVQEVEKRGMPTEIALLPMIESAFNPQANSRSKASGIWQFMPSTGKYFGLNQTWWVDNRRGVTAATNAALTYLQKLHVMFGTWDLALAAYNAGEGTVQRAIEKNRKQGLPTDYASLPLPTETKNYVPKLQAVKNIMSNPQQYGLDIESVEDRPYFTKVAVPSQIDAHLAAQLAGITYDEFTALNPEYKRPVIAATGQEHEVLLPVNAVETFKSNLASNDKPLVNWQTYNAHPGERVASIADKFGISQAQLREVNGLNSGAKIKQARPVLVPTNSSTQEANAIDTADVPTEEQTHIAKNTDTPDVSHPVMHKVKKGETLASIAKHYHTSTKALLAANHIKNKHIKAGQTLAINEDNGNTVSGHSAKKARSMVVKLRTKSGTKFAKVKTRRNLALNTHKKTTKSKRG